MRKQRFRFSTSYMNDRGTERVKPSPHKRLPSPEIMGPEASKRYATCTSKAYQKATVSMPIAVKPFSVAGQPRTYCNSKPALKEVKCGNRWHRYDFGDDDKDCNGCRDGCRDKNGDKVCYFVFTQEICIEVPVYFGAVANAQQAWVECQEASTWPCHDQEPDGCQKEDQDGDEWGY